MYAPLVERRCIEVSAFVHALLVGYSTGELHTETPNVWETRFP